MQKHPLLLKMLEKRKRGASWKDLRRRLTSRAHSIRKLERSIGIVLAWVAWHTVLVEKSSKPHLVVLFTPRRSLRGLSV